MDRNRLRTLLTRLLLLWIVLINSNAVVDGGDGSSDSIVEFRPQDTCDINKLPKKHLVCYYRIEEQSRQVDLNPCLCTHLIYSHVVVKENFAFVAGRKGDLKHIVSLKEKNPWLKVLVSLKPSLSNGQWFNQSVSFHNKDENANQTSFLSVHNVKNKFARRTRDFLIRHGLDGVDIDWKNFYSIEEDEHTASFSTYSERRANLLQLIKSFNEIFRQTTYDDNFSNDPIYSNGLLISLTTGHKVHDLISNYGFNEIQSYLNFVNLPAFDFPLLENDQETDMNKIQHPAQLHALTGAQNADTLVDLLLSLGLPASKITIGVPSHGIFRQVEIKVKTSRSRTKTNEVSILERKLSRAEICEIRNQVNWTLTREADGTAPALIRDNTEWIGFDDELSVRLKAKYAKLRGLAGIAIVSLNDDDPTGKCDEGSFALTKSIIIGLDDGSSNLEHLSTSSSSPVWKTEGSNGDFSDVVERYGNVERVLEQEEGDTESLMPCDKPGYRVHPKDCTNFYRCVKLNSTSSESRTLLRFKYKCGTGLVFDERLAACNHPSWSNRCMNSGEIEQAEGRNLCQTANSFHQKTDNCGYFYYCNEKLHPFQFKCPFELGFDEHNLQCNWRWLVPGCNVPPPNITSQNNIKDLFNSNLIKNQPDQLNSYLNIDSPENSISLNLKDFESKRTNSDTEAIELDKLASEVHITRQRRSVAAEAKSGPSAQETTSIAKSIKNKMNGLIGSVKSLLGNNESKEKVDNKAKDDKSDSSRRQDSNFPDWLSLPFLYNSPSQIVQTYHLPMSTYSFSTNLNTRPVLTSRIPLPKNLSPMLTSANVQSFTKLSPPQSIVLKEFRLNPQTGGQTHSISPVSHNQAHSNLQNNLQSMVNAHSMHHPIQLNKAQFIKNQPQYIENDKVSIIIPHSPTSAPKINNKPINLLNGNHMKTEYKLSNSKSKNLKNNYKEKKIQRRPDIQLSELVKQELNKFRLNSKPMKNVVVEHQHYKLENFKPESHQEKNNPMHPTNINHYQASNSAIKPNVVHYHFEPLPANEMHHMADEHAREQRLHYHHHQQHAPSTAQSAPSNAIIDNFIQLNHLKDDQHVHIPFASSNQQLSPVNKPSNHKNRDTGYDPLLSSDLFKDYSIDIRPIHLKSHEKPDLNSFAVKPQSSNNHHQKVTNHKQSSMNKHKNGFVPMKPKKQQQQQPAKPVQPNVPQPSSSSKNDYHIEINRANRPSNQPSANNPRPKNNKIVDEYVFVEERDNGKRTNKLSISNNEKNTNLLIIPVPDHHPKAQTLEEIQRLITYYPEFFPENFNLNSKLSQVNGSLEQLLAQKSANTDYFVVTVDEKNRNSTRPIIKLEEYLKHEKLEKYDLPTEERRVKNKKQNKQQTVLPIIITNQVTAKPAQTRKPNKKQQTNKPVQNVKPFIPEIPSTPILNTATSKAPVVIQLEIPHGKPEIVERIFDKVKDDLIHTTASGFGPDRPVYISITNNKQTTPTIATSTESILNSSTKDSSTSLESDELIDTSKVYLLGEQQIPQHVFESLKQVINDHITERIVEMTTTEMPSSMETETEVYATRKSSRTTPKPPKQKSTTASARKRTSSTTTSTPKSVSDKQRDDYREDDLSRPIWQQNWPPNISYLTLLRNRSQNKTVFYDDPLIKSQSSSSFNKQTNRTHSTDKQHALTFTITSYLAETTTAPPPTTTLSPFRRAANRFRTSAAAERNAQSKKAATNKQSVDLYLVQGANGQTEIHKQTDTVKHNDVHSSASLQSVKHVDQFEKNSLLEDTSGFVNDNFLRHINTNDNLLPNRTLIPVQGGGGKPGRVETLAESYQLLPSVIKQYQKSRNSINPSDLMPETTCLRAGLFQHPLDCNKFYECIYDQVLGKYVSHAFECTIKVAFDNRIVGCSSLTDPTVCIQY